ncbi:hypothetical protein SDC9_116294 [bioreactor metagenome]|uniref:Uncharacterized protein n=1 Tax=bioreactor metagenome TaxID=1076179 RepID=A0A645BV94_9ZZZZ
MIDLDTYANAYTEGVRKLEQAHQWRKGKDDVPHIFATLFAQHERCEQILYEYLQRMLAMD